MPVRKCHTALPPRSKPYLQKSTPKKCARGQDEASGGQKQRMDDTNMPGGNQDSDYMAYWVCSIRKGRQFFVSNQLLLIHFACLYPNQKDRCRRAESASGKHHLQEGSPAARAAGQQCDQQEGATLAVTPPWEAKMPVRRRCTQRVAKRPEAVRVLRITDDGQWQNLTAKLGDRLLLIHFAAVSGIAACHGDACNDDRSYQRIAALAAGCMPWKPGAHLISIE